MKRGREIDLNEMDGVPVSMYVAQFDDECEAWYSEANREILDNMDVLVNYEVETDAIGHLFYAVSNENGPAVVAEIYINSGKA